MTSKILQFCQNDCSDRAEVNVKGQLSHLSKLSSPEDVKMLRVALFTERGRMLRILLGLQIIHSLCFA